MGRVEGKGQKWARGRAAERRAVRTKGMREVEVEAVVGDLDCVLTGVRSVASRVVDADPLAVKRSCGALCLTVGCQLSGRNDGKESCLNATYVQHIATNEMCRIALVWS